jgi:hypothetical protein
LKTLPDASVVNVSLEAIYEAGTPGNFAFAQTSGGTNFIPLLTEIQRGGDLLVQEAMPAFSGEMP